MSTLRKAGPGRPPKPTELHRKHGTRQRHENTAVTPLLVGGRTLPEAPPGLTKEERERWDWMIAVLGGAELLDRADLHVVEFASKAICRARAAAEEIRKHGLIIEGRFGSPVENPAVKAERDAVRIFLVCGEKLGLSPVDRARLANLGVVGRPPESEVEGLAEIRELRSPS